MTPQQYVEQIESTEARLASKLDTLSDKLAKVGQTTLPEATGRFVAELEHAKARIAASFDFVMEALVGTVTELETLTTSALGAEVILLPVNTVETPEKPAKKKAKKK